MARPKTRRTARARNPNRCVYVENGRRCQRIGLGDPPICRACRAGLEASYETMGRTPGVAGMAGLFFDFLAGRRIRKEDFQRAVGEFADAMGAGGVRPPGFPPGASARGHRRSAPFPGPPPNGHGHRIPFEPDPDYEERKRLVMARQELGFQPREPLTVAVVEKRRKELARKHHPDLGGSPERMVRINQAADLLVSSGQLG